MTFQKYHSKNGWRNVSSLTQERIIVGEKVMFHLKSSLLHQVGGSIVLWCFWKQSESAMVQCPKEANGVPAKDTNQPNTGNPPVCLAGPWGFELPVHANIGLAGHLSLHAGRLVAQAGSIETAPAPRHVPISQAYVVQEQTFKRRDQLFFF